MAKERNRDKKFEKHDAEPEATEAIEVVNKAPEPVKAPPVEKVKFLTWFSGALSRFEGVKPHHMSAVRTYFTDSLQLGEVAESEEFDLGLEKFGFGRKE